MPSLTWKLIALLTLIFAVAVFLWFIFLGPLSRCARQWQNYAVASRLTLFEKDLHYHGCLPPPSPPGGYPNRWPKKWHKSGWKSGWSSHYPTRPDGRISTI